MKRHSFWRWLILLILIPRKVSYHIFKSKDGTKLFWGTILILGLFWIGPARLLSWGYSNVGWASFLKSNVGQQQGDSDVVEWFQRALNTNSQNRSARRGLGFAHLQQGNDAAAVAAWQLVDKMGQELYHMGRQADRARLQRQLDSQRVNLAGDEKISDRSLEWYNLSAQVDPLLRDPWYQIGQKLEQQQAWVAAEQAYRSGLDATNSLHIQSSDLLFWLARIIEHHHEPRDLVGAMEVYDQAIAENNFGDPWVQAQTHYRRGEILREWGQADEAIRAYETVVALRPKSYWALTNLASLLQTEKSDMTAAKSYLLLAIEVNPKVHLAYRQLAQIYEQEGDLAQAKELYQDALDRNEDDAIAREKLRHLIELIEKK